MPAKKSTGQSAENAQDTCGCIFLLFSLAPRIPRAYKQIVSSERYGGLHESTGVRGARELSTPLLRCESRSNWLKSNLLAKRRSKRKKRALIEGPLCISNSRIKFGCRFAATFGWSFLFYLSTESRVIALPAGERCAGVSRRVSSRDGVCADALRRGAWTGCSTLPAPELAGLRKVPIDKILRRTLKRCASLESPLGNPP